MDGHLRAGFSWKQLKDMDLDAISSFLDREPTVISPAKSVSQEPKTPNGSSGELSTAKEPGALSRAMETNGNFKEGLQFASMTLNGHHGSQNGTAAVGSSPSAPSEGVAPIAIIGMSCRFPGGVDDIEKLWGLISEGRSAWSKIPESRFNVDAFYHPNSDRTDTMNVKAGHFLQGTEYAEFDAQFFNISPNEAKAIDPAARMHLEGTYEALENAGITVSDVMGSDTAVFVGGFNSDYGGLLSRDPGVSPAYKVTGVGSALFSNRISHWFDLRGPSLTLDTACSSSVVALHMACQSLQTGESKMAIVSGANLVLDPDIMFSLSTLKFLSPDGKSYMFDQRANGYSRGEGIATLVLKPLSEALRANDPVHAVVRNIRMNQDGRTPGITMPSEHAQRALIQATYNEARLDPSETDFFEAHGTGTQAGDRVEAAALSSALGTASRPVHKKLCVGSIKTLVGHTEACSGAAGVMHAVMALSHKAIVPNCNFEFPSDQIDFDAWKIKVPTKLESWPAHHPRRASVNSFGYGGANVHVILEEAPDQSGNKVNLDDTCDEPSSDYKRKILCLSANDSGGIERQAGRLAKYLQDHLDSVSIDDLVYTLGQRRSMHRYRCAIHGHSIQSLQHTLESVKYNPPKASGLRRLAFIFTGQGAQWPRMGCELFTVYPVFRKALQAADEHVRCLGAKWSLLDELHREAASSQIDEAFISQPLCTAFQIALVNLLQSWNIQPSIVLGHSSGEIAAAYAAGMLTLESALTIAYYRGLLSSQLVPVDGKPQGAMLAAGLSADDAISYIEGIASGKATIACINSPKSVTFSGDVSAINELHSTLEEQGVFSRRLKVNVAYHSFHMKTIAKEYSRLLHDINIQSRHQGVKFYSSVLPGIPVETDTEYWVQNLLSPVQFSHAVKVVLESQTENDIAFIEIGPHNALAGPFRQICESLPVEAKAAYFSSILRNKNGVEQALNLACSLFTYGWNLDVSSLNFPLSSTGLRVLTDLPPYAWNHSTLHWHEGRQSKNYRQRTHPPHELLGTIANDSSDLDMRWGCYIRRSEHPWLKDHVIRSEVLLPGGAYLVMAIEAINQKASISGLNIQGYTFRDITFSRVLVVPDTSDGIEVSFILQPLRQSSTTASTSWSEFRVVSFGPDREAYEHCHGLISVTHKPNFDFSGDDAATLATMRHDKAMKPGLYEQWLSRTATAGNELGPSFRLVSKACLRDEHVFSTLRISERPDDESPNLVSVPLMDSILQTTVLALANRPDPLYGAIVPTSISQLGLSASFDRHPGHELQSRGWTAELDPRNFEGQAIVAQDTDDGLEPVAQAIGVKFVCIPRDEGSNESDDTDAKLYWDVSWKEDPDNLLQDDVAKRWPTSEQTQQEIDGMILCEKATWYCLRAAYESLTDEDVEKMAPHHRKYHDWMRKRYEQGKEGTLPYQQDGRQEEWASTDHCSVENAIQQTAAAGPVGLMTARLGHRLLDVLRGEIDPLSLMYEDDLLNQYYTSIRAQDRAYEHVASFVRLAAHKNPRMRILEIGGGTGSATSYVLSALGGHNHHYPQFSSYVFTDISTGFFEKAEARFRAWGSLITYKALNIEEDLKMQGFEEEEGYDIVVAANVLHATHSMDHTMAQVWRLLKPGGRLILVEGSAESCQIHGEFVFGLVPGWWMGASEGRTYSPLLSQTQWASLLERTGFSGLDICLRDSPNENTWSLLTMVSTKKDANEGCDASEAHIIYDSAQELTFVNLLAEQLKAFSSIRSQISILSESDPKERFVVIVDRTSGSLLMDLDEKKLDVLKSIFAQAEGVLWITVGGSEDTKNARAGGATGLIRTLRSESDGLNFITCDVEAEDLSKPALAQIISKLFAKAFSKSCMGSSVRDLEFAVRNGRIMLPRIVEDRSANQAIMTETSKRTLEEQLLWQEDSCLCLDMGHVGLLDTFRFVHSDRCSNQILDDEVEIEIKAAGLNFHDLMVATGQLPDPNGYGLECAGIISKVGKATPQLKIGDRVCAIAAGSFANRVRALKSLVSIMPSSMDFETGASIPSVFTTSYYSIHHAARLQKNETILIHSAAGGVGQACIKMAQLIGAEVFVTAGSPAKVEFLQKKFGLQRDRILNSRTLNFGHEIMNLTGGKGVDVVINSLAGDALRESWRCLATFGRFIELGKKDAVENSRLDMGPFERSASFISVGWDHFGRSRPDLVGRVLKEIMGLFANGTLTPLDPITTFPMSDIEPAFRFMASGTHMGKIVVTADRDCVVKATPKLPPPLQLRTDASYLLVGGLGGIGVEIAKWMVNKLGAKSLILISRSGMDATGAADAVAALKKPGVSITVRKCDVSDKQGLSAVLENCAQTLPPIRGLVQGAMVLKDAIFPNMTLSSYYQAFDPKVRGSQNLHDLFQQSPGQLDFFVMLSSLGGILGNASQSNYGIGNTFQDALAHYRASNGSAALSINVGKVVDVGWVAQNQDVLVMTRGMLAQARDIRVKDLTSLIEHHIRAKSTGSGDAAAQVSVGLQGYPAYDARFSHVGASLLQFTHNQGPQDQMQSLNSQIAAVRHDGVQLLAVILEAFKQKVGRLLALKAEDIHDEDAITDYGVDSLVAVELRNWIRKEIEVNMTVFEILNGKLTVKGLVNRLVKERVNT